MAGNKEGGLKAVAENKKRYGEDFYACIGALGGKRGSTGGFASQKVGSDGLTGRERASLAGKIGGQISRKPRKYVKTEV